MSLTGVTFLRIGTNFAPKAEYPAPVEQHIRAGHHPLAGWLAAQLDYIELSLKTRHLDAESLHEDIRALHDNGLGVHLHPYYEIRGFDTPKEPGHMRSNLRAVLDIAAETARAQGFPVVMNFHAASGDGPTPRETLHTHSVAFFRWLLAEIADREAEIIITAEHQLPPRPTDAWQRYGDHYAELLALSDAVAGLGLCWDMGHSAMRSARYSDPLMPPADFFGHVQHVHIHDVERAVPVDHRPIGAGDSPLKDYLAGLMTTYTGDFTMEYDAREFLGPAYAGFLQQSRQNLLRRMPEKSL